MNSVTTGTRVLIIVENLPVPRDRRVWLEAISLREAGYTVSVICPIGEDCSTEYEEIDGISVYRHPIPREGNSKLHFVREYAAALYHELRLMLRIRRERGFDIIQACNPPDLIFLVAAPFKWFFRAKFIFDQHDLSPEVFVAKFHREGLIYRALLVAERCTYALADVVIVTNESFRSVAIERGRKSPLDVVVVRNGPVTTEFRRLEPNHTDRPGRSSYTIGYVGILGPQEGIDYLLRSIRIILDRGRKDIRVVIIGGGSVLPELQQLARALDLTTVVEFTGPIWDRQRLLSVMETFDVCVSPEPKNQMNDISTMIKIMEYMALGKPIVQFDLREGRVSAGDAALYAQPNDAADFADKLLTVVDSPDLRAQMSSSGLSRIKSLSWEMQVPKLLEAYRIAQDK